MTRVLRYSALTLVSALVWSSMAAASVTEKFDQTYPLAADGRVSLQNVNGSIEIETWDRNEVRVEAFKKARSRRHLERLRIEIESDSDRLEIRTRYSKRRSFFSFLDFFRGSKGQVRYVLKVPENARLDAIRTVNGRVTITGTGGFVEATSVNGSTSLYKASGPFRISAVNGGVVAEVASLENVDSIHLKSVNGGVRLTLPGDASASIHATSINGGIRSDFRSQSRSRRRFLGRRWSATLGSGDTDISITTVNGGVRIRRGDGDFQASR